LIYKTIAHSSFYLSLTIAQKLVLVYGITKGDGSGYNRTVQVTDTKSKVGGAITNGEYRSQETKAST
jgi:hypothetical protein